MPRPRPTLTPDEARALHHEALVIDSQQPPATTGFLFTDRMRAALAEFRARRMGRDEAHPLLVDLAAQELLTSSAAREQYLEFWHASGVTVAAGKASRKASYKSARPSPCSAEIATGSPRPSS